MPKAAWASFYNASLYSDLYTSMTWNNDISLDMNCLKHLKKTVDSPSNLIGVLVFGLQVRFSFKGFAIFPIFSTWQHT